MDFGNDAPKLAAALDSGLAMMFAVGKGIVQPGIVDTHVVFGALMKSFL